MGSFVNRENIEKTKKNCESKFYSVKYAVFAFIGKS